MIDDTFFGTDAKQALLRRGRALFDLMQDAPNNSYYGRTVGLVRPQPGSLDTLERLIAIQGSSAFSDLTRDEASTWRPELEARSYAVTRYDAWEGDDDALHAACRILADHVLPDDIRVVTLDADASQADLAALADVALACGVLPIAGSDWWRVTETGAPSVARRQRRSRMATIPGAATNAGGACWPPIPTGADRSWP